MSRPIWQDSTVDDVTDVSRSTALNPAKQYQVISTVDCWFRIGESGGTITAEASGTHFLPAGDRIPVAPDRAGDDLSKLVIYYIRDGGTSGKICISEVTVA